MNLSQLRRAVWLRRLSRTPKPEITKPRDMYIPDLHIDSPKPKSRNFR
jgi:hypothetical protein